MVEVGRVRIIWNLEYPSNFDAGESLICGMEKVNVALCFPSELEGL